VENQFLLRAKILRSRKMNLIKYGWTGCMTWGKLHTYKIALNEYKEYVDFIVKMAYEILKDVLVIYEKFYNNSKYWWRKVVILVDELLRKFDSNKFDEKYYLAWWFRWYKVRKKIKSLRRTAFWIPFVASKEVFGLGSESGNLFKSALSAFFEFKRLYDLCQRNQMLKKTC
jgi:hypothetical protein